MQVLAGQSMTGLTSRKDATVRRRELLGSGESSVALKLAAVLSQVAADMLVSPRAGALLLEAACGGDGGAPLVLLFLLT